MAEAYLGDIGTEIILDCNVDITAATSVSIIARKPDGDTVTWSGTIDAGTRIKYSTQALDLDVIGVWQLQPHVVSSAWIGSGTPVDLLVLPLV